MVNSAQQNANPNRSSNQNFNHQHQHQHMRQQQQQAGNGNHHHQQQSHQQGGVNRAVQRPPNQQQSNNGGHHQQSQHHHHHHHHTNNNSSAGVPSNRPTQNGVNPRSAGAPGQVNSAQNPNRPRPAQPGAPASNTATGANPQANPQPPPQILPKGWKREEIVRMRGITAGQVDIVYGPTNPNCEFANKDTIGKKFHTKLELQRIFGEKYDMSLLDFRSGKLSQVALRKQRRVKSQAANPNNYISAAKYDPYLTVPSRQTAGIFKQSVSYVTNNHRNEATPAHILNPSLLLNNPTSAAVQQLTQNQILALSKNLDRVKPTQVR